MIEIPGYSLIKLIGYGGMSKVYLAQSEDYTKVAVKIMSAKSDQNNFNVLRRRFLKEGAILKKLSHSNIVKVLEYGEIKGNCYIIMQFIEGKDLKYYIKKQLSISPHVALNYLSKCAQALDYLHSANVIHRDIKPANIIIEKNSDNVYLTDFGIAKISDQGVLSDKLTATGITLGTPQYMSPEQIFGEKVDARADIYSLGIVFFEMLTGEVPCKAGNVHKVILNNKRPNLPEYLSKYQYLIDRMLEKDINKRINSASELLSTIPHFLPKSKNSEKGTYKNINYLFQKSSNISNVNDRLNHKVKHNKSSRKNQNIRYRKNKLIKIRYLLLFIILLIFSYLLFSFYEKDDTFSVNSSSDRVNKIVSDAKVLFNANQMTPPFSINALDKLEQAYSIDSFNIKIQDAMKYVILEAINHDIESGKFDLPENDNAFQKLNLLRNYFPDHFPEQKKILVIEMARLESDLKKKLEIYYYNLFDEQLVKTNLDRQSYIFFKKDKQINNIINLSFDIYTSTLKETTIKNQEYRNAINNLNELLSFYPSFQEKYSYLIDEWKIKEANKEFLSYTNEMVDIPSGCFINSFNAKEICLESFSIGRYEVTNGMFAMFIDDNPSYNSLSKIPDKDFDSPVTLVDWGVVNEYVKWISEKTNKNFQLPTDAQWEYAALAGVSWNDLEYINTFANKQAHCIDCTLEPPIDVKQIGSSSPNAWSIYDMIGNVWEWTCSDIEDLTEDNLDTCSNAGSDKVIRGGSWSSSNEKNNLYAVRKSVTVSTSTNDLGFRLVLLH